MQTLPGPPFDGRRSMQARDGSGVGQDPARGRGPWRLGPPELIPGDDAIPSYALHVPETSWSGGLRLGPESSAIAAMARGGK